MYELFPICKVRILVFLAEMKFSIIFVGTASDKDFEPHESRHNSG